MEARRTYGDGAFGRRDPYNGGMPGRGGTAPRTDREHRSLGSLFGNLTSQMQMLLRLEIQLAKTEFVSEVKQAGKGVGLMAGAGALAYAGLLAVVASLGFLLGSFMPTWLGFLLAGLVVFLGAAALLSAGRKALKEADFKLDRTSRTLEEDALWMRQEADEVKRDPAHLGSTRLRP